MTKKMNHLIITVCFLVCLFVFGIWSLIDQDKTMSEMEGRTYAKRPVVSLESAKTGELFGDFEDYYNDNFPLRENWVESNSYFANNILKQNIMKDVYIGTDDYLVSIVNPKNGIESAENVNSKINEFADYLSSNDIPSYFALVPNKSTIMEDKLPDYAQGKANLLSDKLIGGFSKNITALDLRNTILNHMNEDNMYFYTDHHWKPKAAFYAYQEVINEMSKKIPEIGAPSSKSDYKWKEYEKPFYGSEARKVTKVNAKKADTVTIPEKVNQTESLEIWYRGKWGQPLINMDTLDKEDEYTNRYSSYLSGDSPEGIIKNNNVKNGQKLLILKDSYANAMIPFFTEHFEEIRFLDLRHYKGDSMKEYVLKHDIDAVVFVHNINSIIVTPAFLNF